MPPPFPMMMMMTFKLDNVVISSTVEACCKFKDSSSCSLMPCTLVWRRFEEAVMSLKHGGLTPDAGARRQQGHRQHCQHCLGRLEPLGHPS
jgi:hypothetical protein